MRYKPVLRTLGFLLVGEAALLIPSLVISLIYGGGDASAFLYTMALLLICGFPPALLIKTRVTSLYAREGFAVVGGSWVILSLFGMLPFLFSGVVASPVDAFFEVVSGFTTTGASILPAVEGLPRGIVFWRSFTHWIGGMGILVFTIALMPRLGLRNMELMRAESPGPSTEKLLPRIKQTARTLYIIYFGLSAVLFILLLLTGMHPYDSAINTFGTAGTGGFSALNASIGGYENPAAEIILGVFMLIFSVNFTVYFLLLMRQWRKALWSSELVAFLVAVSLAVIIVTANLFPQYGGLTALRYAFFQVASIVSTSGFATTDFNLWPQLSRTILVALMVMGACAGSTGGGVKVVRLVIGGKMIRRELQSILHPDSVRRVYIDGNKAVEDNTLRSVLVFFAAYAAIVIMSTIAISADGFDFETNVTAVLTTIGNVGPGLGAVGPRGNFSGYSVWSKLALSFNMLAGRLEIVPVMLLFSRSLWRG